MAVATDIDEILGLIDAVVYGDVFDCAVTLEELWRYSLVPVSREDLARRLSEPPLTDVVTEHNGLYVLRGREDLVARRRARRDRARRLRRRARLVAGFLQHLPFVRGILLTGSVAADDAEEDADVDMLVIVQDRRLALAFLVLASLSRVMSRDVFCPNYYLSERHLELVRRDHYVARELAQAAPLAGNADRLFEANGWVSTVLPNALPCDERRAPLPFGQVVQRLAELPFRGALGDRLDRRARRVALRRLAAHHSGFGSPVPKAIRQRFEANVELRFHGRMVTEQASSRYSKRRAELKRRLGWLLDRRRADAS